MGRFSQFNNFNNSRDLIIQRGNFEFFGDAKPIAGFNRILKRGNQLVGQTINGNHISLFIDGRGNLVDRRGIRVANRDPEIVRQAQTFFLQNRQNFQGGQKNAVDRFLFASGGFGRGGRLGRMTIDLASLSLKEDADGKDIPKGTTRVQAGLAALNFFLNSIQSRCLIRVFENQIDVASGTVSIDLSSFRDGNGNLCFAGETLALMEAADSKAVCNNGKTRINDLINNMFQLVNYNKAQGIAGLNKLQVAEAFGISDDKLDTFGNKLLVGNSQESGIRQSEVVGGPQRVLERQYARNLPGRFCYRSYDFKDVHEGGAGSLARSVEESGILFTHEAEEWLCVGANGFLMSFLFNADGTLLDEAPASIASSAKLLSPGVRNPASCLDCHRDGFRGGDPKYEEQKQKIRVANQPIFGRTNNAGQPLTHGDYFTTNAQYNAGAKQDSNLFVEAQKQSGSYLYDPEKNQTVALLPSSMDAYNSVVNVRRMARELGVTEEVAKKLLGNREGIKRIEFDAQFCQYKEAAAGIVGAAASNPAPQTGTTSQGQSTTLTHSPRPNAAR